jgi:hypothetical protein
MLGVLMMDCHLVTGIAETGEGRFISGVYSTNKFM